MNNNISLTQTSLAKTSTQYASKGSFWWSINYLFVIAVTHFIPPFEEESDKNGNERCGQQNKTVVYFDTGLMWWHFCVCCETRIGDIYLWCTVYIFEVHSSKPDVFHLLTKELSATTKKQIQFAILKMLKDPMKRHLYHEKYGEQALLMAHEPVKK